MPERHLRAVTAVVVGLLGAPLLPAAEPRPAWRWPLQPVPAVLAGFDAPAGPFGPGHRGVDLATTVGARVSSAGAGEVAFAGSVAGRPVVSVQHPDGRRTTYEPVVPAVGAGTPVVAGALLGRVAGTPGHCTAATCLHWGLRLGETYLDPLALVGGAPVRLLPVWSVAEAPAVPRASAAGEEAMSPARGPLLVADRLGRLTARRAGARRAAGSRRARCRPGPRRGGSRGPPRS